MPDPDVLAAQAVLRQLARVSGGFSRIRTEYGRLTARVEAVLRRNPVTDGNLHWASDTGRYRDVWVSPEADGSNQKLFRLYFGPWGRSSRRSAYVVVFRNGQPQIEVRLAPPRAPEDGRVDVVHKLAFFGKRYQAPAALRDRALVLARRGGVPVRENLARLAVFNATTGELAPRPREVLRRILSCGLVKRSLIEASLAGQEFRSRRVALARPFRRKRERFPTGRRTRLDLLLDQRFEAHGLHNRMVNRLREYLAAQDYRVEAQEPFDLLAKRGRRAVIIEAKAWEPSQMLGALRAAAGQLLYYSHLFRETGGGRPALVAVVAHRPSRELVNFMEKTAEIGVIWRDGNAFAAGPLASRLLPGLTP